MSEEMDIHRLAALVRTKRGQRGLREVAKEIGAISASTLSRIEQGGIPDLDTFFRLCRWLGVSPEQFMKPTGGTAPAGAAGSSPALSTPEFITAHLRADRTLDQQTVEALSTMIRLAYEAAARGDLGNKKRE